VLASVLDIHTGWAWVVVIGNAVVGLWALGAHWLPQLRTSALWWFVTAAELAVGIQVILGVVLVSGEGMVAPEFHMFYGFVALVAIAILYGYHFQITAWLYLLYGFGSLFVMGLGIRAMLLG
jgi:hypothetical protein